MTGGIAYESRGIGKPDKAKRNREPVSGTGGNGDVQLPDSMLGQDASGQRDGGKSKGGGGKAWDYAYGFLVRLGRAKGVGFL